MDEELEDKYEIFLRNTHIDIKTIEEAALGGSGVQLSNYYTKIQSDALINALDSRIDQLESDSGTVDLSNYFTKNEVNSSLANKQNTNGEITALIELTPNNNDVIQRKANVWTTRTPAQVKQDMSLDNVNNTSDANKPVSTAQAAAIEVVAEEVAAVNDSIVDHESRIDVLEGSSGPDLTNYYNKAQTDALIDAIPPTDLSAYSTTATIDSELATKSDTTHNHDSRYYTETEIDGALATKLVATDLNSLNASAVDHEGRIVSLENADLSGFVTDQELSDGLATKANVVHNHDASYYTKTQIDTTLTGYATDSELSTGLDTKQPLDSDLTSIAALTPTNDDVMQRKAGAWINRTIAQLKSDLNVTKTDVGLSNVDNTSDLAKPISTATQSALDAKQALDSDLTTIAAIAPSDNDVIQRKSGAWINRSPAQLKTDLTLIKGDVGLANVDNTSDINKPISTATQSALDAKQPLDSDLTAFAGLTPTNDDLVQRKAGAWINRTLAQVKADLGLFNVDNTSDVNKPISTATQTALDNKQTLDSDLTALAAISPLDNDIIQRKAGAWINRTPAQLKTDLSLTKSDVGLSNVDNTADTAKPISTATQTALDGKQPLDSDLTALATIAPTNDDMLQRKAGAWVNRTMSQVKTDLVLIKGDVGLANVDNTSDVNKPISTATQSALDAKQALDSDLTAIAAIAPANDDLVQRKAGAWINRTMVQVKTDLALTKSDVGLSNVDNTSDVNKPISTATQSALDAKQGLNANLTSVSAITATNDDIIQRKGGAWVNRTVAQYKTDLALTKSDVGLGNVDNVADVSKPISTLAQTAIDAKTDLLMLPVANGTHFNGNFGNASTSLIQTRCRQSRKLLRVIAGGATKLQVEWANKYTTTIPQAADATCELNGPNSVTVRMAIEYPAGKQRVISGSTAWSSVTAYVISDQVTSGGFKWVAIQAGTNQTPSTTSAFWRKVNTYVVNWNGETDGSGTVVFAAGDYKQSKYITLTEKTAAGDMIAVLGAFDSGSSSNYIPYAGSNGAANHGLFVDWIVDAAGGMAAVGSALPDTGVTTQTNGNTTTANDSNNNNWMKIPYATAITGNIPTKRCVAVFGDSMAQGYGGDIRDGEPCGVLPRSVDGTSWWRVAQGGNRAACYTLNNASWQYSVVARCSATVVSMGLNDISNGTDAATTKTYLERLWRALAAQGTPLFAGMLTPASNSSDSWATTANQSRFTNGGTIATTQYPTDDATYLTSIYGISAMWISQDGASVTVDGGTVRAGQVNHPLEAVLDWRSFMADLTTSWKWAAGLTSDGIHPNPTCVGYQTALLVPQMEPVIMAEQQMPQPFPPTSPYGSTVAESLPRSAMNSNTSPTTGSAISSIGVSAGRWAFGIRLWSGTATAKAYTVLQGSDAAKMKILQSGASAASIGIQSINFTGAPVWIPAGQQLVVVLACPAANSWGGAAVLAGASTMHVSAFGFIIGGTSIDTVALTGVINTHQTFAKFAAGVFRPWAEIF